MYKHSACSSVITPSFSSSSPFLTLSICCTCSIPLSPSIFHLHSVSMAILSENLHPKWWNHTGIHLCLQNTPSPHLNLNRTFTASSHTHTLIHAHVCTCSSFKTQTQPYFPINNACWSYCSQRGRESERMSERREKKPRGRLCTSFHEAQDLNLLFFKKQNVTQLQLWGDDPLYPKK